MKKRIVIASILKPLNDTRMTEKIATSLAKDVYDVHVIGFASSVTPIAGITYHSLGSYHRISFKRLFARWKTLSKILQIRPSVIVVTTHELLFAGMLAKVLTRAKLVYDVQENYYLNIRHTDAFPKLLRLMVAIAVRANETLASHFIDLFVLAEQVYREQLKFLKSQIVTVENKAVPAVTPEVNRNVRDSIKLLFTGTLSRITGVFEAISFARKLHSIDPNVRLTIAGYAPLKAEREELKRQISDESFITLIGGDRLIDHSTIVALFNANSANIISYEITPATAGRIPTKLYECIANQLPTLFLRADPSWLQLCQRANHPFFLFSDDSLMPKDALDWLSENHVRGTISEQFLWENEADKLRTAFSAF